MVSQDSPIIEYYPLDFKTDLNGKQQEWEAVVLIPFIDEVNYFGACWELCNESICSLIMRSLEEVQWNGSLVSAKTLDKQSASWWWKLYEVTSGECPM